MQEPSVTAQVPHPEDLVADIRSSSNDYSCDNIREPNNVPMSICFLVREQAKSLVAIQDLQKRLNLVENVQGDVIETLMQFRNYLCDATNSEITVSSSHLTDVKTPITNASLKCNATTYHTPFDPPRSILKNSSYPSKVNENLSHEFHRNPSIITIQDQPHKHFDSTKSKDSALESDKQDSGLDSDCRDHNEGHPSVKFAPNWGNVETNDQLLQLLDEISCRSEYLQKQLAVAEEGTVLPEVPAEISASTQSKLPNNTNSLPKSNNILETNFEALEASGSSENKNKALLTLNATAVDQDGDTQRLASNVLKINDSGLVGFLEAKSFYERSSSKKRIGKSIDSALVSSILKETNVVDLQRQALIYLVDNAVLNTKLRDLEQALINKNIESEKIENSLKEEARLLMMENREFRICLDEQKMESNILKSRVAMLERVLQSMNVENQELNWQLGESLNLQQFSRKSLSNLTSSSSSSPNFTNSIRKSSSLPSQSFRSSFTSPKAKLFCNSSRFLDTTIEESSDCSSVQVNKVKCRSGPIHSSTPFQRPLNSTMNSPYAGSGSPLSFYSVKKCLKSGHTLDSEDSFKSAKGSKYSRDCDIPETCVKNQSISHGSSHEPIRLPMGNVSKFPFNTILEKLKANSEYRLSKNISSVKDSEASASTSDIEVEQSSNASADQDQQKSQTKDSKSPQVNVKSSVQARKSRNIHQRIQNILDRIVAESEEAS